MQASHLVWYSCLLSKVNLNFIVAIFGSEMSQSDLDVRANGVDKSLDGVLPPCRFLQLSRGALSVLYRGDCAGQNAISQVKFTVSSNYFVTFLQPFSSQFISWPASLHCHQYCTFEMPMDLFVIRMIIVTELTSICSRTVGTAKVMAWGTEKKLSSNVLFSLVLAILWYK